MDIMSTNFAKTLFRNLNMTSNCDVTNSAYQIQTTIICHWMKAPPEENFLRTPLAPALLENHKMFFIIASNDCLEHSALWEILNGYWRVMDFDAVPESEMFPVIIRMSCTLLCDKDSSLLQCQGLIFHAVDQDFSYCVLDVKDFSDLHSSR